MYAYVNSKSLRSVSKFEEHPILHGMSTPVVTNKEKIDRAFHNERVSRLRELRVTFSSSYPKGFNASNPTGILFESIIEIGH